MKAIAVIPARFGSVRFPGKMLADQTGKTLIQHVCERAAMAKRLERILVATDDARIASAVRGFGGEAVMTRSDHPNGTSRIAELIGLYDDPDLLIVNVQGDEPEIDPTVIDLAIETLEHDPECAASTVASPFAPDENPAGPNIVKVVVDQRNRALYFSRARIPFDRDGDGPGLPLKHVGLYVYRPSTLRAYATLSPTPLEVTEKLEQLRLLEHGFAIAVAVATVHHHGIDTPEQYQAFVTRYLAGLRR